MNDAPPQLRQVSAINAASEKLLPVLAYGQTLWRDGQVATTVWKFDKDSFGRITLDDASMGI